MGLLSDFKRLFFAQKSVAKSAGKKAVDKSKEFAEDVKDEASEVLKKAKEAGQDLVDDVKKKSAETMENVDLDAAIEKAKKFTDKLKGAVTGDEDKSSNADDLNEIKDSSDKSSNSFSEDESVNSRTRTPEWLDKAGEKAAEAGEAASEKFQEMSEKIGKKAMDLSDELSQKTRQIADKLDKKLDEIDAKARKMAKKESMDETPGDHAPTRHDENPNLTGSTLEGSDSFFDKANRFADGESITPDIKKAETKDPEASEKKAYGFEDLDGDGNEIVDDAIIDNEEE